MDHQSALFEQTGGQRRETRNVPVTKTAMLFRELNRRASCTVCTWCMQEPHVSLFALIVFVLSVVLLQQHVTFFTCCRPVNDISLHTRCLANASNALAASLQRSIFPSRKLHRTQCGTYVMFDGAMLVSLIIFPTCLA